MLAGIVVAPTSRADVVVDTPPVRVQVGQSAVFVRAPFVRVMVGRASSPAPSYSYSRIPAPKYDVSGAPPSVPYSPVPPVTRSAEQQQQEQLLPQPQQQQQTTVVQAMTLNEFARSFKPDCSGGKYEVVLVHPCTCKPVKVCFSLPPGNPKRIVVRKNQFVVRYGLCKVVTLQFNRDGSVSVRG
jgi:hypothetical protein